MKQSSVVVWMRSPWLVGPIMKLAESQTVLRRCTVVVKIVERLHLDHTMLVNLNFALPRKHNYFLSFSQLEIVQCLIS